MKYRVGINKHTGITCLLEMQKQCTRGLRKVRKDCLEEATKLAGKLLYLYIIITSYFPDN